MHNEPHRHYILTTTTTRRYVWCGRRCWVLATVAPNSTNFVSHWLPRRRPLVYLSNLAILLRAVCMDMLGAYGKHLSVICALNGRTINSRRGRVATFVTLGRVHLHFLVMSIAITRRMAHSAYTIYRWPLGAWIWMVDMEEVWLEWRPWCMTIYLWSNMIIAQSHEIRCCAKAFLYIGGIET